MKQTREEYLKKRSEYNKAYRAKHRQKITEQTRQWKRNHKEIIAESQRKQFYGMGEGEFHKMFISQKGCCVICGKDPKAGDGMRKSLAVDHNHKTNKVRELLCHHCNAGLGWFMDSPTLLLLAAAYLLKHQEVK